MCRLFSVIMQFSKAEDMSAFISPSPEEIKKARKNAGLTQEQAAKVVLYSSRRTWQDWEYGVNNMPPGLFELFLIKTGQKHLY